MGTRLCRRLIQEEKIEILIVNLSKDRRPCANRIMISFYLPLTLSYSKQNNVFKIEVMWLL